MVVTETEGILCGASIGPVVPFFLRRYADKVPVPPAAAGPLDFLGDFKRPSVGIPILGSIALSVVGLEGARGKGPLGKNTGASKSVAALAGSMGAGGFYSWVFGPVEVAAATGAARAVAAGAGARAGVARARGVSLARAAAPSARVMGTVAQQRLGPEIAPFPRRYPTPEIPGYVEAVGGF